MNKTTIIIVAGSLIAVSSTHFLLKPNAGRAENNHVQIISGGGTDGSINTIDRKTIRKLAKQRGVTVQQIEHEIAHNIRQIRELNRRSAAGYGPGSFILSDAAMRIVNPDYDPALAEKMRNAVIDVSGGAVTDLSRGPREDGKLVFPAERFHDERNLYIRPVDVSSIDGVKPNLVKYSYAGTYLEGNAGLTDPLLKDLLATSDGRTGWTGLSRLYDNHPTLGRFLLEEIDIAAGNLTTLVPQATINARVGDYPATLVRMTDAAGNTMSRIDWAENNRRTYSVTIAQVDSASIAALVTLANGVAKSSH